MLAVWLLLVVATVLVQGRSIMKISKLLCSIVSMMEKDRRTASGGDFKNGVCDCDAEYPSEDGVVCVGAIGRTQLIEESKIQLGALMRAFSDTGRVILNPSRAS